MNKSYFIYGLWCPILKRIRYIGISIDPNRRFKQHLSISFRNKNINYTTNWINFLIDKKLKPRMIIIEITNKKNWKTKEKYWIDYFKKAGNILTNHTNGGNGSPGRILSDLTKRKISQTTQGRIPWNKNKKGYSFSDQAKINISNGHKGLKKSKSHCENLSNALKGKKKSKESIMKMANSKRGKKWGFHTKEAKEKMSEIAKRKWNIRKSEKHF